MVKLPNSVVYWNSPEQKELYEKTLKKKFGSVSQGLKTIAHAFCFPFTNIQQREKEKNENKH